MGSESSDYMVVIQLTDAGDYLAYVPELPGCAARGDTVQEADDNLRTAIDNHLALLAALSDVEDAVATASPRA